MDTLYYDGNCPLCMREIRLLSRIADSGLALVDLHWSHTRWGVFFSILTWPVIGPVADAIYDFWARKRYQRLYGCGDCAEQ